MLHGAQKELTAGEKAQMQAQSLQIIKSIVEKHGGTLEIILETDTIIIDVPEEKKAAAPVNDAAEKDTKARLLKKIEEWNATGYEADHLKEHLDDLETFKAKAKEMKEKGLVEKEDTKPVEEVLPEKKKSEPVEEVPESEDPKSKKEEPVDIEEADSVEADSVESGEEEGYKVKAKPELAPDERQALSIRAAKRSKKPHFRRQEWFRYVRVNDSWRKPRGMHSKMRRNFKYRPPKVSTGYRGPKMARGRHPSGFEDILVHNPKDLEGFDPKKQAARIGHTVGTRKRNDIKVKADELGIRILNWGA